MVALAVTLAPLAASGVDPGRSLTQALHRIWQVPQGLPQATIHSIRQTQDGYLWLGTQTGLVRFDGIRFTSIGEASGLSWPKVWIRDLVEDAEHHLWLATDGNGLIRLGDGAAKQFTIADGLPSDSINSLFYDADKTLWVCTNRGLARQAGEKFTVYRTEQGLASDDVRAVCRGKDQTLWAAGAGGQLSVWNGSGFSARRLSSAGAQAGVQDLLCSRDGTLWVGTTAGLVRIRDGVEKRFGIEDGLADNFVYCLAEGADQTIWVGTKDGFSRLRNGEIESFRAKDGLSQSTVYTLFEDREGSLWVGTKHGLNQFLDRRTVPFTASEGLASNNTGPVIQDRAGNIWVGTLDAGLCRFDGRRFSVLGTDQGLASDAIRALADDGDGGIWVGTDRGLNHLREGRVDQTLAGGDVRCIVRDAQGTLWVGTAVGASALRGGKLVAMEVGDGAQRAPVAAMIGRRDGSIFLATEDGQLDHYVDGKLVTIPGVGAAHSKVDAFFEDRDGLLWIGSVGEGLWLVDGSKTFHYTMRDGLFDDDIYGIVADDQDRLGMACSKGIFFVNRADLTALAAGRMKTFVSTPFSPTDALRTIECKSGVQPAAWRMNDGRLWFSTIRGVIVVDPTRLQRSPPPTPVIIEETIVNGKSERADQIERLPPGRKNLEFRYTGLSFLAPGRITFRHKLEGFDRDWVEADSRREAFYTNLPPGPYRFRVVAVNVDGSSSEAANSVVFVLAPHFYQRVWFWPMCAAALALLGWRAYRVRVRRIRERLDAILAERSRIARELHDTLLQGFSGVTMEMQALSARLPETSAERATLEEIIRDAAASMTEARRSVAGLRGGGGGAAAGTQSGLASAIEQAARQMTETRDVRLKLALEPNAAHLPPDVEYNLLRIASEAVSNSVRHSGARTIEVALRCTDRRLHLKIKDDGCGFSIANGNGENESHYGLIGMRERAGQIGARFDLQSRPGSGTTVSVELPTQEGSAS
jgi:signal transduction histidine kinase/ligand-binding sensor domain-containing protein